MKVINNINTYYSGVMTNWSILIHRESTAIRLKGLFLERTSSIIWMLMERVSSLSYYFGPILQSDHLGRDLDYHEGKK